MCIRGNFPRIFFHESVNPQKILEVKQWGSTKWTSMGGAFRGAYNLDVTATDTPDLSRLIDMAYMFMGAKKLIGTPSMGEWDTRSVVHMSGMFSNADLFNQPIGNWDTSAVVRMSQMFAGATAFNQSIGSWNTEKVTDMRYMFRNAHAFNQPIGAWNTGGVTDMSYMFLSARAFNQPIGEWDTSSVTNVKYMLAAASAFNQPVGSWNTGSVTDASRIFSSAYSFNQPLDTWDTSNVTNMSSMFYNAHAFNQPLDTWDTSNVTNMSHMFSYTPSFNQPLDTWNISRVTDMTDMLNSSKLSITNYDKTLLGWSIQAVQPDVPLGAINLVYCDMTGRSALIVAPNTWNIIGDKACIPTITSLDSISADLDESPSFVTMYGSNFHDGVEVKFGDQVAEIVALTSTQIRVRVPAGVTLVNGLLVVDVTVKNLSNEAIATAPEQFTYYSSSELAALGKNQIVTTSTTALKAPNTGHATTKNYFAWIVGVIVIGTGGVFLLIGYATKGRRPQFSK